MTRSSRMVRSGVRSIAVAVSLFLLHLGIGVQAQEAPGLKFDPGWPKPLPNKWKMGGVTGLAVDRNDDVWVLTRPAPALGDDDMGYGLITPSIGVEVDTLANYLRDPDYDHIAIDENGRTAISASGAVPASSTSDNVEDNVPHQLRIDLVRQSPCDERAEAHEHDHHPDDSASPHGGHSSMRVRRVSQCDCRCPGSPNSSRTLHAFSTTYRYSCHRFGVAPQSVRHTSTSAASRLPRSSRYWR